MQTSNLPQTPPREALERLPSLLLQDPRITSAWLEGSFGRGEEDRYSDIDLHVHSSEISSLLDFAQELLAKISKPVLLKELFAGKLAYSLLESGVRVDIVLHAELPETLPSRSCRVLVDTTGRLEKIIKEAPVPPPTKDELRGKLLEFWRCIAMLPVVLGRGENIVAVQGLVMEAAGAAELLALGHSGTRVAGMKRLNSYLPPGAQKKLEEALTLPDLSAQTLANAHLSIAALVASEGRGLAEKFGFDYPVEIEKAALSYVHRELALLGMEAEGLE